MSDVVRDAMNGIYCWPQAKAGMTLVGTHIGQLVLSDERLMFLSTGTSGLAKQVAVQLTLGSLAAFTLGRTRTEELDLSALNNKGSFSVALADIRRCTARRRWDLAMYLSLDYASEDSGLQQRALMSKTGFQWQLFRSWAENIREASDNCEQLPWTP